MAAVGNYVPKFGSLCSTVPSTQFGGEEMNVEHGKKENRRGTAFAVTMSEFLDVRLMHAHVNIYMHPHSYTHTQHVHITPY